MLPTTRLLTAASKDPETFLDKFWPGGEPWQRSVLTSVRDYSRTAVVSCNGAGKTWVGARVAAWFLLCHPGAIVVTTAGTWTQVRRQLWKEIAVAYSRLPKFLQLGKLNITDWNLTTDWYAIGMSTADEHYFEGFHAPYVLIVVDEAKSVRQGVFDAINRIFAGRSVKSRLLVISSPGRDEGPHYDAFHNKADMFSRVKVSPFEAWHETPTGQRIILPPTQHLSAEYIADMEREYGEGSPLYQSMICGEWLPASEWCLFPADGLRDARDDILPGDSLRGVTYRMGADVARNEGDGDECVLYTVSSWEDAEGRHYRIEDMDTFFTDDSTVFGDRLKHKASQHGIKPQHINVDGTGMGGPCCDYLKREGWPVNCIQFGASPTIEQPSLVCMRDQLWWTAAEIVRRGLLHNLTDERTRAQMTGVRYGYQSGSGKLKVEPKDVTAARMRKERPRCPWKSPDRADGLILALHDSLAGASTFVSDALDIMLEAQGERAYGLDHL